MRTDTKFSKIILILAVLGILVSGWLLSIHLKFTTGQASLTESCSIIPLGTDSQGCETVAVSDYSKVLGIPLAAIAMSFYATILLLIIWAMKNPQACYEAIYFGFFLSTLAIPITVAMALISRLQLHSFCPGCATLWLINLALWPAFVKQMGLNWGNALSANTALFTNKSFIRSRIYSSLGTGVFCLAVISIVALVADNMQKDTTDFGGADRGVKEYQTAPIMTLPIEATQGNQIKPQKGNGRVVMQIIEFSDLQCPACRLAARFFKPFLIKHADEVSFSYRQFPLDGSCNPYAPNGMHTMACVTARTAICAGEQGKFFAFHDAIFDDQENLSQSMINGVTKSLGLDDKKIEDCLKNPKTEATLQQDMQWGNLIGLESTPTIMINGHRLSGALSPAQLESILDGLRSGSLK